MADLNDINLNESDPFKDESVKEATAQKDDMPAELSYNPFQANSNSSAPNDHYKHGPPEEDKSKPALNNQSIYSSILQLPQLLHQLPQQPPQQQQQHLDSLYSATSTEHQLTAAELKKRQEQLDRRAEELRERENAMQKNMRLSSESVSNFPPLPGFCPVRPCFYQDVEAEIPVHFQRLVNMIYYFWLCYVILLVWNLVMCLSYFVVTVECNLRNHSAVNFTLSLLNLIIFTPASYVFWFRPVYRAFKYDSSINFFVFFFVFFMQFITLLMQCLAIDGWGFAGILNGMDLFTAGYRAAAIVGVFMFLTGVVFAIMCAFNVILLLKVHQLYRNSGGSLEKAQIEFSSSVKDLAVNQDSASQSLLLK
ncbi:hypothetical protein HELRODRAFT_106052 [Helobdella robusta]|uniref:Secretory carrier-associated membrane protein n=1 Tax=Helobdella robusta TaxID=6412 RepID=T1EDZ7_HELRO|nr:hypothetical protein HELRODRAFT_106052 [Helobdella robusta]ESO06208.1 hypothetical protein HELRODRAFT_106052 [Helobdella robusta]